MHPPWLRRSRGHCPATRLLRPWPRYVGGAAARSVLPLELLWGGGVCSPCIQSSALALVQQPPEHGPQRCRPAGAPAVLPQRLGRRGALAAGRGLRAQRRARAGARAAARLARRAGAGGAAGCRLGRAVHRGQRAVPRGGRGLWPRQPRRLPQARGPAASPPSGPLPPGRACPAPSQFAALVRANLLCPVIAMVRQTARMCGAGSQAPAQWPLHTPSRCRLI